MSQFRIRLAKEADLKAVSDLTVRAYVDDGLLPADDDYIGQLVDVESRVRDAEVWVAEVDGVVAGAVTYCPPGSRYRELSRLGEGEFRMLAVDPSVRGRGAGRALVQRCIDRSRQLGLNAVVLCSMPTMREAHRLYGAVGFTRDESLDWDVDASLRLIGFRLHLHP